MSKGPVFLESAGVGGSPCLDFVNTVGGSRFAESNDSLESYGDFAGFAKAAGAIGAREEKMLGSLAANDPEGAAAALQEVKAARENLFRVLHPFAAKERPCPADLEEFNGRLAEALRHGAVVEENGSFAFGFREVGLSFVSPLWPFFKDAAELLASPRLQRLRECGGETCGWLFLDTTKNRTRHWCEMKTCGNRAKARRHRERLKTAR